MALVTAGNRTWQNGRRDALLCLYWKGRENLEGGQPVTNCHGPIFNELQRTYVGLAGWQRQMLVD